MVSFLNSLQTLNAELSFQQKKDEMKRVFEKFDTNKDGNISLEEYKAAAKALDKGVGDTDAVKAFKAMDYDKDGFIDFREFMEMFNGEGNKISSCTYKTKRACHTTFSKYI
ncbi:putative EF-hand domain pair protein [Medicago truncatula]|uniref:EF-hand pair protein n=1 Tax=Medicago truncatula TaxID=3880 RepID=G7K7Z1_MEDTR|nr:EF-hand pair protein [Medicago truncatula]RHN54040.1 putative EF-hand domain pair protein [Medicago truncatula]